MTRVAAIDCGTNTIKLMIADLPGQRRPLVHESRMVRLGQGVDRTGRLADDALARAFAVLDEYAVLIATHGVEDVRFCATSATRDAENAEAFRSEVLARIGVEPEVISGEEEARLAFDGAVRHLDLDPAAEPPLLVIDIGGGSTEVIIGADTVTAAHSMDIGSVRLHERHVEHDPPTAEEVAAMVADIEAALDASPVDIAAGATVIGVAGTICTLSAGVQDLPFFDVEAIHHARVPVADLHDHVERLVAMSVADRRSLPYMHPGRADVIDAGALIASRIMARSPATELVSSMTDILHGIAWSMVGS